MHFALIRGRWFAPLILIALFGSWGLAQARQLPDFTRLVEAASPAVVNISTIQKISSPQHRLPPGLEIPNLPEGAPFGDWFRHFFGEGPDGPREFDAKSLGSGFIISPDGYLLTNYHVVKDADEVLVRLSDRRELAAQIVGSDPRSDLALLKIDAKGLPVVKTGSSSKLKVGEWVLAIGSPFGFEHSATAGIVSAKGRSLPRENYVPFIQTDVAINPGNSGGPLFNLDGEVVGINSQIYSRTGGFMGLSFAIPIEVAMDVAEQLKTTGHVTRGWLGVLIQDVTRELGESFGMKRPEGALVAQVLPGSPAEKAGIKVGDVIVEFNGKEIIKSSDLPPLVGTSKIGEKIPLRVVRNGQSRNIVVEIAALPEEGELQAATGGEPKSATDNRLGVEVTDLTEEQRKKSDLKQHGVMVTAVREGPASRAGVRRGDIILMINGVQIENSAQFKRLMAELPHGKSVPMLVQRRNGPTFLALKLPEKK